MARTNTRGYYTFADGYTCWVNGFSAQEKKREIARHGNIVRFIPT